MNIVRLFVLAATTFVGYLFSLSTSQSIEPNLIAKFFSAYFPVSVAFSTSIIGFLMGLLLMLISYPIEKIWKRQEHCDKFTILISFLGAAFVVYPLGGIFAQLPVVPAVALLILSFLILTGVAYLSLTSLGEMLPWLRNKAKYRRRTIKILDTNVIIDGRVYDIIRTRFLEGNLYIPQFVLEELQHIADSQDVLRRQRGRRGLDVLRKLQEEFSLEVGTYDRLVPDMSEEVDSRLVRLAKILDAQIVTNDFNLNQVAGLQEVPVLNINELALSLKPSVMPRETLEVFLIKEGNHPGQAVGYLEDGTMVVVENGRPFINENAFVTVSQVIQTERGRMIFAEVPEDDAEEDEVEDAFALRRKTVRKTLK